MNLASIIDSHPDSAPAIISAGEITTYGALRQQVDGVRGGLVALGVEPGDRVAILMASNWYFVVSYLAVLSAGAVAVPMNPQSPTAELVREFAVARPKVVVVGATAQVAFSGVDRSQAGIETVLVPEGVSLPNAKAFEDLVIAEPTPVVDRQPEDLAALIFTSGTAGSPKAAMLSHNNLLANIKQSQSRSFGALESTDVGFGVLPLFHIYGLNAMLGRALYAGASLVLVQRFDPHSALATIRERGITTIAGVPPMYEAWASLPVEEAPSDSFASVRLAASGASKLDPTVGEAFRVRFGLTVREGYGLTEASPVVTTAESELARLGSIGVPLPGVHVRLVDGNGEDVLVGDPGEIWVKGENVFQGYLNDAEATARALTDDGWLRTGDIAVADDGGYLTIVDRQKDLIIVSGFNVYPAEVEEVLAEHPGVAAVAVVGVPHPHTGESVKAFVQAKPDRMLDEDELIDFCANELARYKCPTKIMFVQTVPRGAAGKILRRDLR